MTGTHNGEPLTLMAVHAHPDDECIGTGGVLAKYAAAGARTVLVTATRGEEGEIHDPDLTEEEARPRLAEIREGELRRAVAILGVGALEFLGYRDSGMMGTPANQHPDNFHNADRREAVGRLVRLIRRYRPQVLVTYNVDGGYGHPDHLQTHRVTWRAFDAAGDPAQYPEAGPAWQPRKLYATAWSREGWQKMIAELQRRGLPNPFEDDEPAEKPAEDASAVAEGVAEQSSPERRDEEEREWGQPDDSITAFVDVSAHWRAIRDALRAHRTQFAPDSRFLNLPDDIAALSNSTEHFVLLRSRVPTTRPEDDLFSGVRG